MERPHLAAAIAAIAVAMVATSFGPARGAEGAPAPEASEEATPEPSPTPSGDPRGDGPDDPADDRVIRIAGTDRIATAIAISRAAFDTAEVAMLARADRFPDALAAAPLAAEVAGPILLTGSSNVHPDVADELQRLGVQRVYLLGGTGALDEDVRTQLTRMGFATERLAGANRFETAVAVAEEMVSIGGPLPGAMVALGDRPVGDAFPDALAASQVAIRGRMAVLLVTPSELPAATRTALTQLLEGDARTFIIGGRGAIGGPVRHEIEELRPKGTVDTVAGADRYETAAKLAYGARFFGPGDTAWIASGVHFADALAAGPAAVQHDAVILLTRPERLDVTTRAWLEQQAVDLDLGVVLGGPKAVSADQDPLILDALR